MLRRLLSHGPNRRLRRDYGYFVVRDCRAQGSTCHWALPSRRILAAWPVLRQHGQGGWRYSLHLRHPYGEGVSELATEKKARLERLAMAAFTGLIGHFGDRMSPALMAETAVELAKALMKELEKPL